MVDAHCHIDLFPDPYNVMDEATRQGISVLSMTNLPSHFQRGRPHIKPNSKIRLALGLHPLYAAKHESELSLFEQLLNQTSYIGEVGLDFSTEGISTKALQIRSFEFLLHLVSGKKKILSLHSRGAEKDVLSYLLHYNIKSAIFHWYSGPEKLIESIVAAGFLFSINPAMTRSKKGADLIKKIPLDHLLTESDGPFVMFNGRAAEPTDMESVEKQISHIKAMPESLVSRAINNNFKKVIDHLR
jgi:TatD DNase family protein